MGKQRDKVMKRVKHPKPGKNYKKMHEAGGSEEDDESPNYYDYGERQEKLPKEKPIYDRVKKKLKRKIAGRGAGMVPLKSNVARERYKKALIEKLRNGDNKEV